VTRMRCWRVTTILNDKECEKRSLTREKYTYELSFEYLMAKSCLKWIKMTTEQAMLISVCLQVSWDGVEGMGKGEKPSMSWLEKAITKLVDDQLCGCFLDTHPSTSLVVSWLKVLT
jgi:hypothetical protein